ncbi:MAG: HEPN domain-containing protein [Candidatus Altiarchaeota archaeon]
MEIVREELKLSREFANDARLLVEQNRFRSAANRAYYSVFHAAKALLTSLGVDTKSHAGAIGKFGECVVKEGLLDKTYGKILTRAANMRDKSDYQVIMDVDEIEVRDLVDNLGKFIDAVENIIEKKS